MIFLITYSCEEYAFNKLKTFDEMTAIPPSKCYSSNLPSFVELLFCSKI